MSNHPSRRNAGNSDELDTFAHQIDEQLTQSTGNLPGSSALDPSLWSRIRRESQLTRSRRSRKTGKIRMETAERQEALHADAAPPAVPPTRWHRGSAAFLVVATVICVVMLLPRNNVDPQFGGRVLEAPIAVSPEPGLVLGCDVEPLSREEVLAIVLDPEGQGFLDERQLFATPPPGLNEYSHMKTWLPESNGIVDMATGERSVRHPDAREFSLAKSALDRYLRCQSEGSNFQLWALESPREVQRQILVLMMALNQEFAPVAGPQVPDTLTELSILETIDQVGPALRSANGFNVYMFIHEEPQKFEVQSNPERSEAYIAENPDSGEVEYAWIATQWTDPETGEILSTRGAALDEGPALVDGTTPNLVVMILTFDADRNQWLVEWLVPTV